MDGSGNPENKDVEDPEEHKADPPHWSGQGGESREALQDTLKHSKSMTTEGTIEKSI